MENLNEKQKVWGAMRLVPVGGEIGWPNSVVTGRATSACEPYGELIELGTPSWPECHGHLAGLGFRSRLSPRLPDREALCSQAARGWGSPSPPPPSPPYPQMRAAKLEDQVASGTMNTAPKTGQKATV